MAAFTTPPVCSPARESYASNLPPGYQVTVLFAPLGRLHGLCVSVLLHLLPTNPTASEPKQARKTEILIVHLVYNR